jgi:hypothetical protein
MGSKYPRRHLDERGLKLVEGVYRNVWPRLGKISFDQPDYEAFRMEVINRILNLVRQGVTDPDELRTDTMSHFGG